MLTYAHACTHVRLSPFVQTGVYVLTWTPLYDASYAVDVLCWIITLINLYRLLPKKLKGMCETVNIFKHHRDANHWSVVRDRLLNLQQGDQLPACASPALPSA